MFQISAFSCHFGLFVESNAELPIDNKWTIKSSMITIMHESILFINGNAIEAYDQQKVYKFTGEYLESVVD